MAPLRLILAATGASGSAYFLRLIYHLMDIEGESRVILSPGFFSVLQEEAGFKPEEESFNALLKLIEKLYGKFKDPKHTFIEEDWKNVGAKPASGSTKFDAMVVIPASMKTISGIAHGSSNNLIERAADVTIKEKRKLILVPRETPLSTIHLHNLTLLAQTGALILPASPGFYHRPESLNEIYDFIVDRVFQHIGVEKRLIQPWKEN